MNSSYEQELSHYEHEQVAGRCSQAAIAAPHTATKPKYDPTSWLLQQ